jgi:hypothetical protein
MTFSNPVVGGTTLTRPAIQNPGYIQALAGWHVDSSGSAEFNDVIVRGQILASVFEGTDFVIDSAGIFFY